MSCQCPTQLMSWIAAKYVDVKMYKVIFHALSHRRHMQMFDVFNMKSFALLEALERSCVEFKPCSLKYHRLGFSGLMAISCLKNQFSLELSNVEPGQ